LPKEAKTREADSAAAAKADAAGAAGFGELADAAAELPGAVRAAMERELSRLGCVEVGTRPYDGWLFSHCLVI
jgi:hypothetical protein